MCLNVCVSVLISNVRVIMHVHTKFAGIKCVLEGNVIHSSIEYINCPHSNLESSLGLCVFACQTQSTKLFRSEIHLTSSGSGARVPCCEWLNGWVCADGVKHLEVKIGGHCRSICKMDGWMDGWMDE
jgi:hypothetical protein